MINPSEKAKLLWRCRRGMLELDLMLISFAERHLETFQENQVDAFARLLECTDPELFSWLMGHEKPSDRELEALVEFIKLHNRVQ